MNFNIDPLDKQVLKQLRRKIDLKTKPIGSLGRLEDLAIQIGLIQQTLTPSLLNPHILVFAGDHGLARSGVSAFPQEVTHQMVLNFLNGGAAINVFAEQNDMALKVVDAGVNHDFLSHEGLVDLKVRKSTSNTLEKAAMSAEELNLCLKNGSELVDQVYGEGCNIIGFGEMGIGNTSAASLIMSKICKLDIDQCVGRGTGVDDKQLRQKKDLLNDVLKRHNTDLSPLEVLRTFGGFEVAQMCGAMLQAAANKMILMVDGFIATSAFLVANELYPEIKKYAISCHVSEETGHRKMLDFIGLTPLLDLNMRLGEGTGAAVAYPIIKSAVAFLNEMASFEEAGVSNKE